MKTLLSFILGVSSLTLVGCAAEADACKVCEGECPCVVSSCICDDSCKCENCIA